MSKVMIQERKFLTKTIPIFTICMARLTWLLLLIRIGVSITAAQTRRILHSWSRAESHTFFLALKLHILILFDLVRPSLRPKEIFLIKFQTVPNWNVIINKIILLNTGPVQERAHFGWHSPHSLESAIWNKWGRSLQVMRHCPLCVWGHWHSSTPGPQQPRSPHPSAHWYNLFPSAREHLQGLCSWFPFFKAHNC